MLKKRLYFLLFFALAIAIIYLLGPKVKYEKVNPTPLPELDYSIDEIESYVQNKESKFSNIKPDNQSQFIWKSENHKTKYAVLFLHGYSASHGEFQPIIDNFSKHFGCNVYLHRLALHGLDDEDAFADLTPKLMVESAKEAIRIAKTIGEELIIIGSSTGATLTTYLAAYDPSVSALIMTSPNFDLYDTKSNLLLKPWGKLMFKLFLGGNYRIWDSNPEVKKYWTNKNRIEGALALRSLLDQTMTDETFSRIKMPVFAGYYYKNSRSFDNIISIEAIKNFGDKIKTPDDKKTIIPISTANGHVMSSKYLNPEWEAVQRKIFKFCQKKLNMNPVPYKASIDINGKSKVKVATF